MDEIIKYAKEHKLLHQPVAKFTLLVNEAMQSEGALVFVPFRKREIKIVIPAPFHESLFKDETVPTYQQVLSHAQAIALK